MDNTFTDRLKEKYKIAQELNKKGDDFYYCAVPEGNPTKRRLDLERNDVFCVEESQKDSDRPEYRIQAYLVKKAKENGMRMDITDLSGNRVDWELIDAERNFAGVASPKKLDLLVYSESKKAYIILELKQNRALSTAKEELTQYIEHLRNEINGANMVYDKNVSAENVYGFIVWPAPADEKKTRDQDCEFGVIEFKVSEGETQKELFTTGKANFNITRLPIGY